MSDKVKALLAKALSTTSDDEAVACFRKARTLNGGATVTNFTTSSTTDWEALARKYHTVAYTNQELFKKTQAQALYMSVQYRMNSEETDILRRDRSNLRSTVESLRIIAAIGWACLLLLSIFAATR